MKVRSLDEASSLVTYEVERLLTVVAPTFVRYPLRVGPTSGRLLVGLTAGGAALLEEFEADASVASFGAAAPGTPLVLAADLPALVIETRRWQASVRIRRAPTGGIAGDPRGGGQGPRSGDDRMVGRSEPRHHPRGGERIAKRLIKRWAAGVTPIAGIAYDGWDAQKTVAAIARMPLPGSEEMAMLSDGPRPLPPTSSAGTFGTHGVEATALDFLFTG